MKWNTYVYFVLNKGAKEIKSRFIDFDQKKHNELLFAQKLHKRLVRRLNGIYNVDAKDMHKTKIYTIVKCRNDRKCFMWYIFFPEYLKS